MKRVIAVFDIGKTNKKILLFDQNFQVVYQHEQKFPVIVDEDGSECDDIDRISSWIRSSIEEIISQQEYELYAVNFSTYGASLMFLDEKGKALTPVYNYLKEVSPKVAENLYQSYGGKEEFCRKTASPALGLLLNSGVQILWMKKEKPEIMKKSKSILHFPQYLSYSLTGEIVSEPTSIGCHTFMWDYDNMQYHKWLGDNEISLPEPLTNDKVFPVEISGKTIDVGIGIHDSSASLVPYLKGSKEKFILISTGTWCINMNPFNSEALTSEELEQDCLCFMSPEKQQVKSSRLFMGYFHEVWVEKMAEYYHLDNRFFKRIENDTELIEGLEKKYGKESVFFPTGKESFEEGLKNVDLTMFIDHNEAYLKFLIDLTELCVKSIKLIIASSDDTKYLYVSGGFARNKKFIPMLAKHFPDKKLFTSEIDNSSALGAALVIGERMNKEEMEMDLGLKECLI